MAIKNFEENVDVQNGALRLEMFLTIDVLVSCIPYKFSSIVVMWLHVFMTPLSILVRVHTWIVGQARGSWSAHGILWVFLFAL